MTKYKASYFVIDGIDGGGKTTLFERLKETFVPEENGGKFCYTREPGGSELSERIRHELLHTDMSPLTELLLFSAARAETRSRVVEPALRRGAHVISDRSDSATYAYQIHGRQQYGKMETFWNLRSIIEPPPDLYIFLDLDPAVASARMIGRARDRFDTQSEVFFKRVRDGYKNFARRSGVPCHFVNADQAPDLVYTDVWNIISISL